MNDTAVYDGLVEGLARDGWAVADRVLDAEEGSRFRRSLRRRLRAGSFSDAAVGRAAARARVRAIRGDRLCWIGDAGARGMERRWMDWIGGLQAALNRALYFGLRHWEGHYAVYPPGARYGRHVDRFRDDDARVVSTVLYLNPRWRPEDGGQLRLYPDGVPPLDIHPAPGRFVCFLSDGLHHEVIRTERERLSVVGWFRRD